MEDEVVENDDPSVPTELLELHVDLENVDVTPEEFKEAFGS
jgi:hypothetical protein